TVRLAAGTDGALVLDTQGPYNHELPLTSRISTGDYNTAPDTVSVAVGATPLAAGQFVAEPGTHGFVGLIADPANGTVATVTVGRQTVRAFTLGASRSVTLTGLPATLSAADVVTITVNGTPVALTGAGATAHLDRATGIVIF